VAATARATTTRAATEKTRFLRMTDRASLSGVFERSRTRSFAAVAAPAACLAALALALGLFRLTRKSLWFDEVYSIAAARLDWSDLVSLWWEREGSMGFFYGVLKLWSPLGASEAATRMLAVAAGVFAVIALVDLGTRLFDRRVGILAGGLLAVHPLVVAWMQQVRGYTLAMLLAVVATWALVRAVERRTWGAWLLYALTAMLAAYSHLYGGLVVAAHGVALLLGRREALDQKALTAWSILAVAAVPPLLFAHGGDVGQVDWIPAIDPRWLGHVASQVAGGNVGILLFVGAAAILGLVTARRFASWSVLLVVAWLAVPPLVAVVVSLAYKPLLYPRYLIVCVPALVLLSAVGLSRLRGWALVGALGLAAVPIGYQLEQWYAGPSREDWRQAESLVDQRRGTGDGVRVSVLQSLLGYRYYAGNPTATLTELLDERFDPTVVPRDGAGKAVWLIVHTDSVDWERAGDVLRDAGLTRREVVTLHDVRVEEWR
jgi:mannosyltransferase